MKKKVLCTAIAVAILLTQTASAAPWQMRRNQLIFDSEIGFYGNVTLQFASDGGRRRCRDRNKRTPCIQTHLRHQANQRNKVC